MTHGDTVVGALRLFGPTRPKTRYDDRLGKTGEVEDENGGRLASRDGGDDSEIGWQ